MQIYDTIVSPEVNKVLEDMTLKLAEKFGITQRGNRVTLRWYVQNRLVNVHMIVESVSTVNESNEIEEQSKRYRELFKKHPDLEAELYFAEHGEYPQ